MFNGSQSLCFNVEIVRVVFQNLLVGVLLKFSLKYLKFLIL